MQMQLTCVGGIIALYSHLCRSAKFCLLPNHQASDEELSTYRRPGSSNRNIPHSSLKRFIEKHKSTKIALLILVLLGACMVICVGALMPAISGKKIIFLLANILVCGRIELIWLMFCLELLFTTYYPYYYLYWSEFLFCSSFICWRAENRSKDKRQ